MKTSQKENWNKEKVLELLDRSDQAVWRAVHRIYKNQTLHEQAAEATMVRNNVGFRVCDADILTSMAKFYERKGFMTPKQTVVARKRIKHYTRQLLLAIKEN